MRRNQYLITNDVERYMAEYEVRYAPPPFFYASAGAKTKTTTGQRGPRRDWPTRAIVGGVVFCMGSRRRVRIICADARRHPFPSSEIAVRPG